MLLQNLATTPRMLAGLILWLLVFAYLVLESFQYLSSFLCMSWDDDTRYQTSPMVQFIELIAFVFTYGLKCRNKCEVASIPYFCSPTGLIVCIDPSIARPESPPSPSDLPSITIRLEKPSNPIGRTSQIRAIYPEIPLDYDDAVSSRHALVNLQPDGSFVLRDIGSYNGTIFNGIEIKSLVDIPLKDGDRFTLGHWTSITVKAIPS